MSCGTSRASSRSTTICVAIPAWSVPGSQSTSHPDILRQRVGFALLDQWVADYGEDSDFVKVRVRGVFPNASSLQFIGLGDPNTVSWGTTLYGTTIVDATALAGTPAVPGRPSVATPLPPAASRSRKRSDRSRSLADRLRSSQIITSTLARCPAQLKLGL